MCLVIYKLFSLKAEKSSNIYYNRYNACYVYFKKIFQTNWGIILMHGVILCLKNLKITDNMITYFILVFYSVSYSKNNTYLWGRFVYRNRELGIKCDDLKPFKICILFEYILNQIYV